MKKRILAVLIATALVVSVTGCAGNATSSSGSTSASSVAESSDTSTQTSADASSEDESKRRKLTGGIQGLGSKLYKVHP